MADQTVVKNMLTDLMIKAGEDLIKLIDQSRIQVSASFWLYQSDSNTWRLIIVSPEVASIGPRKMYAKIQALLAKQSEYLPLELKDISVVGTNDSIASLLRTAIRTGDGISGIRFTENTVNGSFIEDAYIYRMT
jgi:hypothetical protein